MNSYKIISSVGIDEFLNRWDCSEKNNPNKDQNSIDRMVKFKQNEKHVFWIELDKMEDVNKIILPFHASQGHFFKTSNGGSSIKEFLGNYNFNQLNENTLNDCITRINFQIYCFKNRLKYNPSYYEGFFMYVTPKADPNLGQTNKNDDFLYAGNFHQFASYALLIQQNGFKPIRFFFCANAT